MAKKAGMATGIEVARISVKVSPDTKLFRRELKSKLDAIEKTLKPELGVGADTDPFKREVRAATTDLPNAKIKVDADVDRMKKKLDTLSLSFEKRVRGALDQVVNPETVRNMEKSLGRFDLGFDKQIETLKKEVRQARNDLQPEVLKQQFDTGGQGAELRRQIKEFDLALERAKASNEAVTVAINPDLNEGRFVAARAKIAAIFSKPVKVDVGTDINKSTGLLDKLSSIQGPGFGSGVNPAGYAVILAGVLALAAPLVGLITTALLSLPGLLSLVLAPVAAVTLGLDGFKKAAEAIKPQFDHLKKVMSDAAQTAFTPVLTNLANTVFPALERSLPSVTQGLANMAQGVVNAFNQPGKMEQFEGAIRRIGEGLSASSPGVQGFTSGLIGLIDQFSLKLPAITDWFNQVGTDFDAWVAKISKNGELSTAFDGLGGTLRTVLDALGGIAEKGFDFIKKPGSMDDFIAGLKNLGDALRDITELSGKLNEFMDLFKNMLPALNWEGIKKDITDPFTSPEAGWRDMFGVPADNGLTTTINGVTQSIQEAGDAAANTKINVTDMLIPPPAAVSGGGSGNPLGDLLNGNGAATAAPPVIPVPDTTPAETKITEYQSFVDTVSAQVRGSLEQATSGESLPAPNFEAFKAGWSSLPGFVTTAIGTMKIAALGGLNGIVAGFVTVGNQITAEVAGWAGKISGALAGLQGVGATAGAALMSGLIAGMQAGLPGAIAFAATVAGRIAAVKGPIPYDRKVLQPNGEALMFGLGVGMETGFQPVLDQAKSLAEQISKAFEDGTDVSGAIDTKQLDKTLEAIDLEKKRLKVDMNNAPDKESKKALKSQIDQLQVQRDALGYQKDRLKTEGKYGDAAGEDPLVKAASGLMKSPVDFAKATGKQFMSDIGISGEGAISKAVTEGIQYIFQIGSVDEALSIKDRTESKKALSVVGR